MYSILFIFCVQAFLAKNAYSTLIGPAIYGNGFGLGNSAGSYLTAASAERAGWVGLDSPTQGYAAGCNSMWGERALAAESAYAPASWAAERNLAGLGYAAPLERELVAERFGGFGAYEAAYAPGAYGSAPFAGPLAGAYGGEGIGDVSILGEMPVAGTTMVTGQVPILGAVRFAGDLPAGGVVSIAGSCGCGNQYYL